MPYLEHDGVTRELPQGETLVGSGSEVDWRLQTINLAPRHFTVHVDGQGVAVLAPCRSHDVDVNGNTITEPRALTHGDEIIAGAGIFGYLQVLETPAPAPTTSTVGAYLIDIRAGLAYPLGDDPLTVGRDPINQIIVRDAPVSRFHAEVRSTTDHQGFAVRSMGASGSSVNGVLVGNSLRTLTEGDLVRIGNTTLRFTSQQPPAIIRIVAKGDAPVPGPRNGTAAAVQRPVEAPTTSSREPVTGVSSVSNTKRNTGFIATLVLALALLLWLILHAVHSQ